MKKFYSLVLIATALLVGTNVWAEIRQANDWASLKSAWEAAENNDEIQLTNDISMDKALWLGTVGMNDDAKSITLNLNGHTLSAVNKTVNKMFIITHGELNVINGNILQSGTNATSSTYDIFHVSGSTYKTVNAKTADSGYYSHLNIAANVTLTAHSNAIVVDRIDAWYSSAIATKGLTTPSAKPYNTNVYTTSRGLANGARVDVFGKVYANKYCIKANGNLGASASSSTGVARTGYIQDPSTEAAYVIEAGEELLYSPFIYIHSGAELKTDVPTSSEAIAAYSGGYSRWMIEGTCVGSTGVYVKSGQLEIKNATIASNYTGTYNEAVVDRTSGVDAGGSGIVMESSTAYAGGIDVTVSGNTTVTPTVGYAVDEAVSQPSSEGTKVNNINIEGGVFHEGEEGTIKVTQVTADGESTTVAITGGTVEGGNSGTTIGDQNLTEFLQDQSGDTHATVVATDAQGNETIVISEGAAPLEANTVSASTGSCNWVSTANANDTLKADKTLTELQISSKDYNQTLVISAGVKLEVGRVVLGAKAQIVVKPGAKFVVTGEQGLAAFQESNLVLETQEGNPAIFLFNPAVTSNTHPMATVEFISKSYVNGSDYASQRFGIPTNAALTAIDAVDPTDATIKVRSRFYNFDYANNVWNSLGYINGGASDPDLDMTKLAEPFGYYQMYNYVTTAGTKVIMKGALVGNASPELGVRENFWNGYANSYMAPMNIQVLLDEIPGTVDKAIYLYDINEDQATWEPLSLIDLKPTDAIQPMQPFLIRNTLAAAEIGVDYTDAVWTPATTAATAPARRSAMSDITRAKMIVKGEGCIDRVTVAEGAEFTAEFDNGYDAAKYMNDGINMYVSANEKMSIFATNDIEGTYVGLQTVKGGNYSIEFANVQGEDLTLIDHATGARVLMVEGNTYEFAAEGTNDYRFEIVKSAKMPTAIENAEAVKSAKGIYTITGQYMGEMNVWNTLPAGVYVVNGEKLVK